jgi:hypothetical protein
VMSNMGLLKLLYKSWLQLYILLENAKGHRIVYKVYQLGHFHSIVKILR